MKARLLTLAGGALLAALAWPALLHACGNEDVAIGGELYFPLAHGDRPTREQLAALGRQAFFDPGLSASGRLACASCHSPVHASGPRGRRASSQAARAPTARASATRPR